MLQHLEVQKLHKLRHKLSTTFSNIVLIGNNSRYDDTMAGHMHYPYLV